MLVLGLILILGAAAVTTGAIVDGGESVSLSVFGLTIDNITVGGVFLAGLATTVVFFLGLWMVLNAMARARRKRHDRKETTRRQEQSVSEIAAEKARLAEENERLNARLTQSRPPAVDSRDRGDHDLESRLSDGRTSQAYEPGHDDGAHSRSTDSSDTGRPTHPDRTIGSTMTDQADSSDQVIDYRTDLTNKEERAGSTTHRDA